MQIRRPYSAAMRNSLSLAGAIAAVLALATPAVVQAQQAGASTGIEEIVVTAQRREENICRTSASR